MTTPSILERPASSGAGARSEWPVAIGLVVLSAIPLTASGLWLTLTYAAQPGTGELLYFFRLVVGSATIGSLVLGITAVRRRDIDAHRAWMTSAYALGLGAGTQVFTQGFGEALLGTGVLTGDLLKGGGWAINLAVAEWAIRRSRTRLHGARS
jgi:hypothetical protein